MNDAAAETVPVLFHTTLPSRMSVATIVAVPVVESIPGPVKSALLMVVVPARVSVLPAALMVALPAAT